MTCDNSIIFNGLSLPSDAGAYVAINNMQLIPSPYVNINLQKYTSGDKVIGGVLKITLNGEVLGSSFNSLIDGQGAPGIKDILDLSKDSGCVDVDIRCDSTLINGFGRIISAGFNEGPQPTWVNRAPYSIEIDLYENNIHTDPRVVIPDFNNLFSNNKFMLKSLSEEISWSISEDAFSAGAGCYTPAGIDLFGNKHIKLNFNITAIGIDSCAGNSVSSGTIYYGLEAAEKYIQQRLNEFESLNTPGSLSYIPGYDFPPAEIEAAALNYFSGTRSYMDFRNLSINPSENSISVNGEIIYRPKTCLNPDVFTEINIEQNLTVDSEDFTISGSIKGLSSHKFEDIIKLENTPNEFNNCAFNDKMNRAETFLNKINNYSALVNMVECYASAAGYITDNCIYSVNSDPCVTSTPTPEPPELCNFRVTSQQIGRNLSNGEINFTFNLSNSPNCDVLGATKLDVSYTHDRPHDNIVEILIPGRGSAGSLVQNLCCSSVEKYDINIDAVLNKKNCNFDFKVATIDKLRECANKLLLEIQTSNPNISFDCWFLTNDVETIGNNTYKLSRTYVKPSC